MQNTRITFKPALKSLSYIMSFYFFIIKSKQMKQLRLCLLLFGSGLLLLSSQCKKSDSSPPLTELQKLPPITQGGLNTFGCLINGNAFVPGGGGILDNTLYVSYDPTFQGGKLGIRARYYFAGSNIQIISLGGDSINNVGTYNLQLHSKYSVFYVDDRTSCNFDTFYDTPISGVLTISRFDIITRIISGTFSFKVSRPSCGTIDCTDGRFDVKYQ